MINNIYELENGRQYVVIAEENIDNKKYYKVTIEDLINLSIKVIKVMKREL